MRVLDFSQNLPGPYATWVLRGQGADVIKVEPPRGDPARLAKPLFERLHAGKRSIVLDLRDPASTPIARDLIRWADVLVEGFRPGVMERLGVGPSTAHALNPSLIYCRISAYGQSGPRRSEPAHDLNLQALTGFTHYECDPYPRSTRLPIADLASGLAAVAAIHAAMHGPRHRVVLDLALPDALLGWVWLADGLDLTATIDPTPLGRPGRALIARLRRRRLDAIPHYALFRARDGWLAVGIVDEPHFWRDFARALGMGRAARLPFAASVLLRPLLRRRIARRIRTRTVDAWLTRLRGLPVSPVHSIEEALRDAQLARLVHGSAVRPPLPGAQVPAAPAPALDQHRDAILAELHALTSEVSGSRS